MSKTTENLMENIKIDWEKAKEQNVKNQSLYKEFVCKSLLGGYWYKKYKKSLHWALVKKQYNKYLIYFINESGLVFDRLRFRRKEYVFSMLKKNGFLACKNAEMPYCPIEPLVINLGQNSKTAPYSKGKLWKRKANSILFSEIRILENNDKIIELIATLIIVSVLCFLQVYVY